MTYPPGSNPGDRPASPPWPAPEPSGPPTLPPFRQVPPQYLPQGLPAPQNPPHYGPAPQYSPPPPFQPVRRRRGRLAALLVSTAVLLAGIGVGVYYLQRSDTTASTGAANPVDAVRTAAAAVAGQNVDRFLGVVNPDETKTFGTLIDLARGKLTDTRLVAASGPLIPILHLAVRGLTLKAEQVNNDLAFVTVTGGTAAASVNQADEPAAIRPPHPVTKHASTALHSDLAIAVVKRGGGWFISPTTTLFEYLRRHSGLPAPNFAAPQPISGGADSPQAALSGLLRAIQNNDLRGAAGYLSAKDVPALRYYYDTFAHQLAGGLAKIVGQASGLRTTVTDMSNGLSKVTIDSADLRVTTTSGDTGSARYRAGCIISTADGARHCIPAGFSALTGIDSVFVVAENDGGTWRISPIATMLEYARILVTKGNVDAFYRRADLARLTPTTQTIRAGTSTAVRLNDGGWAHVVVTAPGGSCAVASPGRYRVRPDAGAADPSCTGVAIPSTGSGTAVVYGPPYRSGQVDVELAIR
jgi:hypothetical protein